MIVWNYLPNENGIFLVELSTGTKLDVMKVRNEKVWGHHIYQVPGYKTEIESLNGT